MFFCTWLICQIWWQAKQAKKILHFFVISHILITYTGVIMCAEKLRHMLRTGICFETAFLHGTHKKASADADAFSKVYDKVKSSFSVSFAFCKMYETLGSHPFFWRRFKILLLYLTSTSFRKSIKSSSFINAIILSAVNR